MVKTHCISVSLLIFACWTILGASVDQSWFQSDHLERDITTLGLDDTKLSQIHSIFTNPLLQNDTLLQIANNTGMSVTPHLIYRYLESVEWSDKYHGKPVVEAIVETIEWRHSFGITQVDTATIAPLIRKGLGYTSVYDKHGRVILYLKIGRNNEMQSADVYHKHMMYMVERADRQCINGGSGQFIAVLDLTGIITHDYLSCDSLFFYCPSSSFFARYCHYASSLLSWFYSSFTVIFPSLVHHCRYTSSPTLVLLIVTYNLPLFVAVVTHRHSCLCSTHLYL